MSRLLHVAFAVLVMISANSTLGCFDLNETTDSSEQEIVGGVNTTIEQNPWQVAVLLPDSFGELHLNCGGAVVNPFSLSKASWILTAQHCAVYPPSQLKVAAGLTNLSILDGTKGQIRSVDAIEAVPGYSKSILGHDIALLHLSEPLDLSNAQVRAIPLISAVDVAAGATNPGVIATATGWGATSSDGRTLASTLQSADLPLVSNDTASQAYQMTITSDQLAAGGLPPSTPPHLKGACHGDSGGPLTVTVKGVHKLVGITSWGGTSSCAQPGLPDMFARVSSFLSFVNERLNNDRVLLALPDEFGNKGSFKSHTINVPVGTSRLTIRLYGLEYDINNADLYVRHGAAPTTSMYDCKASMGLNEKICVFHVSDSPLAGTWYISLGAVGSYGDISLSAIALILPTIGLPPPPHSDFPCLGCGQVGRWLVP